MRHEQGKKLEYYMKPVQTWMILELSENKNGKRMKWKRRVYIYTQGGNKQE